MTRSLPASILFLGLLAASPGSPAPADAPPGPAIGDWPAEHAICRPLPLGSVKLSGFLGKHVDASNRTSLLAGLKSPIPAAIVARARGEEPPPACRRLATDSDFHKWLEGASYALRYDPSLRELAREVGRIVPELVKLQDPDGYLGTRISPSKPFDERVCHDLYVAGHFIEAAVAHFKATGSRVLLDEAVRLADFYLRALRAGHRYFKIVGTREHPEIEIALVRLARATGEKRFLEFSRDVLRLSRITPPLANVQAGGGATHAVRLCYLLSGAAEIVLETGDEALSRDVLALWNEIVTTRMYVTGGIGYVERVPPKPYDLPQSIESNRNRDIAETCASVALMMLSWRVHAITGKSRPMDVVERILYNHYLGAISPDHLGNFYYNPLRRVGDLAGQTDHGGNPVRRTILPEIHSTTCCLPNAWRFFGQLPEYVFSRRDGGLCVNLYTSAVARCRLGGGTPVRVEVATRYPDDGSVKLTVSPERPAEFPLGLRIPPWCTGASVSVCGGGPVHAAAGAYHVVRRTWRSGDVVLLDLPMPPTVFASRPEIAANRGQVALQRGPVVYCLEKQDAGGLDLARAVIVLDPSDPSGSVKAVLDPELGFHVLKARVGERPPGPAAPPPAAGAAPYFPLAPFAPVKVREVTWIPFAFRANRAKDTRWITFIPFAP